MMLYDVSGYGASIDFAIALPSAPDRAGDRAVNVNGDGHYYIGVTAPDGSLRWDGPHGTSQQRAEQRATAERIADREDRLRVSEGLQRDEREATALWQASQQAPYERARLRHEADLERLRRGEISTVRPRSAYEAEELAATA